MAFCPTSTTFLWQKGLHAWRKQGTIPALALLLAGSPLPDEVKLRSQIKVSVLCADSTVSTPCVAINLGSMEGGSQSKKLQSL
jgi:hypothetical protein